MIDDLATRVALSLAAFALLATGMSVLQLAPHAAVREATHGLAIHVARQLDAIGRMDAEISMRVEFPGNGTFSLPASLAGAPYRLEIRATNVQVSAKGFMAAAPLRERVHPFAPDREAYARAEMETFDAAVVALDVGYAFVVARTQRVVDGAPAYLTFAYLPR